MQLIVIHLKAAGRNVPHSLAQGILANPLGDDQTQKWVPGTVCSYSAVMQVTLRLITRSIDAGGADTLHSAMNRFFVVMMLYPDVQRRAQQEIDTVVGSTRLPRPEEFVAPSSSALLVQTLNMSTPVGTVYLT